MLDRRAWRHRLFVAAVACFAIAAGVLSWAGAQSTVALSPSGVLLKGDPGQTLTGSVRIDNPTKSDVAVTSSIQDFAYNDKGELTFYPENSSPLSAASWITINPAAPTVAAGGKAAVRYSVAVPPDAKPGTHWAVVFFETGSANPPTTGKTLATFKVRVGFVVYVDVGKGHAAGKVAGIIGAPADAPFQYHFVIQYLNTGNLVSLLNGKVDVRNGNGDTVVSIPIDRQVALPGAMRILKANMVGPLPAGDYDALVILNPNNVDQQVAGEYTFHLAKALTAAPQPNANSTQSAGGTATPVAPNAPSKSGTSP